MTLPPELRLLPGASLWGPKLRVLAARPQPLWIFGDAGTGTSTLAAWLALERGGAMLDGPEHLSAEARQGWLKEHPRGVVASHLSPEDPAVADLGTHCLPLRLPSLSETPDAVPPFLAMLARKEDLDPAALPSSLGRLPCPGNLRGLSNRFLRWRLLGALPEATTDTGSESLPITAEDLATNLHALERLLLHRALRRSYGNRLEAAKRLGVSRRHLYLLIARHGDPVRGVESEGVLPKRLSKRKGE